MTNTLSFIHNPGNCIASTHLLNIFSSTDAFTIFSLHFILLISYDPTNKCDALSAVSATENELCVASWLSTLKPAFAAF